MATHIKVIFDESRSFSGKRSIKARLQAKGVTVGLYLVRKLMKQQGLFSKQPQKNGVIKTKTAKYLIIFWRDSLVLSLI
ncbi:hypothetical protein B0681_02745 [Moraxella porci DSM 25326]|uniref:HTH-like domain-containing protein n=1 Tax=Moraxella porci DSM 25326 TaxID=573983 RepID=A0A1T0CWV1_9GAMM|nr:hypothetical protein B0681_02745 [Moraxella porci DSM 25326]